MQPPWIDPVAFGAAMLEELANAPRHEVFDEWVHSTDRRPAI